MYQPDDQGPIAPSAVAISGQIDLPDGSKGDFAVPRALRTEEMPAIAQQFATGARNALAAGFDGVEVSRTPTLWCTCHSQEQLVPHANCSD